MTNFRQLCEDLVNSWDVDGCDWRPQHQARWEATVERARNALAESEPEGPTDEELLRTYGLAKRDHNYEGPVDDWLKRAERAATVAGLRAAIAADRAQRQPVPPEPGEVQELVEWLLEEADDYDCIGETLRSLKCRRAAELLSQRHPPLVAIPGEEYHEDMGSVTWWRLPVEEPPWVGTPNDSDWPGYHTHFTPAPPEPLNANGLPLRGR